MFFDERNTSSVGYTLLEAVEDDVIDDKAQINQDALIVAADHHWHPTQWDGRNFSSRHWWRWEVLRHIDHYLPGNAGIHNLAPGAVEEFTNFLYHECGDCSCDDDDYREFNTDIERKCADEDECCTCAYWYKWRDTKSESMSCHYCNKPVAECACKVDSSKCAGYDCLYNCIEDAGSAGACKCEDCRDRDADRESGRNVYA